MPILFVVKKTRRPLYVALRRLVAQAGLVGVLLERRQRGRRRRQAPIGFPDRRSVSLRQPLDADAARTWERLGFVVLKVHALPAPASAAPPRDPPRARHRRATGRSRGRAR
jgi:hypothetical protein